MNPTSHRGEGSQRSGRRPGLAAWLVGSPRGRWGTSTARWFRNAATAALLVAAVAAWALALIQPWRSYRVGTAMPVGLPVPPTATGPSPALRRLERLVGQARRTPAGPVVRDPFREEGWEAEAAGPAAGPVAGPPPATPGTAGAPTAPGAAEPDLVESLDRLRLDLTVVQTRGESWAVIDGRRVRQGDSIAGMEIVEIAEGRIKLRKAGVTCLLRME